jgi:transcriptional regulator with XRE-family HTH domain
MRLSGIEIAPSTLSEYESGITQPSLAKARALAKLYTCSVERLFPAKLRFQEKTKGVNDATE